MDSRQLVKIIARAADDRKAQRIVVQDLSKKSDVCEYQVICSGSNDRQTQAICSAIESTVREKAKVKPLAIEGKQTGHWILLDYGNIIVHVFLDEIRGYYALEELWPGVENVPLELG
ncbi:MAG: ribosome silencing factor [Oligoflexus sp.]